MSASAAAVLAAVLRVAQTPNKLQPHTSPHTLLSFLKPPWPALTRGWCRPTPCCLVADDEPRPRLGRRDLSGWLHDSVRLQPQQLVGNSSGSGGGGGFKGAAQLAPEPDALHSLGLERQEQCAVLFGAAVQRAAGGTGWRAGVPVPGCDSSRGGSSRRACDRQQLPGGRRLEWSAESWGQQEGWCSRQGCAQTH